MRELARLAHLLGGGKPRAAGVSGQCTGSALRELLRVRHPCTGDHDPVPMLQSLAVPLLSIDGDATIVTSTLVAPHGPLNIHPSRSYTSLPCYALCASLRTAMMIRS
ncbi:hypothetical protein B0H17DRAFT_1199213 [Mycena rosella]|uniref:Uncharacterized protein n=1 Tax=Mycena rosella TaxID=1033263 RepID=A0AAD7DNE1_MYCRO|nr:hypothetical protein B0H17DRAFT_1199213 [Mycena rosella]